jgi:hypothetical protein
MTTYSTLDVVKKLNIPRERLREWVKLEFIHPTIPSSGKGTRAIFTDIDIVFILIFKTLIDEYGLQRSFASKLIKSLRSKL